MVSARPCRDNTLFGNGQDSVRSQIYSVPGFNVLIHRSNRGVRPYWKGDVVVTFQWALVVNVAVCAGDLVSKQYAYRFESVRM